MNPIERYRFAQGSPACASTYIAGLLIVVAGILGCEPPTATSLPSADSAITDADSPTEPAAETEAAADTNTSEAAPAEPQADDAASPAPARESDAATDDDATEARSSNGGADESLAARDSEDKPPVRTFSSSRAPSRPGEAEKISFDDLVIGLQADVVYREWMMGDRPKELDGKKVHISGYMHAGAEPVKTKEFVLLRNLECKFGPGGQADHLAQVYMKPGITTKYPGKDPIKVEGTLKIEPFMGTDGNTWSLYKIVDAEVVR